MCQTNNKEPSRQLLSERRKLSGRFSGRMPGAALWLLLTFLPVFALPASATTRNPAISTLTHTAANYLATGAFELAANALERALRIEPENAELWHFLAQVHHYRGDYAGARSMAAKSSTLSVEDNGLKARNAWLIALGEQASQGGKQQVDAKKDVMEQLRQLQQADRLSKHEIASLQRELQAERERYKQLLAGVGRQSDAEAREEVARLSAELQQVSAARRQAERGRSEAEEASRRLNKQLLATRSELEEANQQRVAANKDRQQVEAALAQSQESQVTLKRRLAATVKTASKNDQTGVVRTLKEKLAAVSRELETSLQERKQAANALSAERRERRALEKTLAEYERHVTPAKEDSATVDLREALAAEHEYSHELEEKIRNYRERLYEQGRELRILRRTVARAEGELESLRERGDRPLFAARTDYRAWRKYRLSGRRWGED